MPADGNGAAWGALIAGAASVATLPLAVYLTRFSESYDLLHAGLAIPLGAGLGLVAIALSRRTSRRSVLGLGQDGQPGVARVGRILGVVGLCLAAAGVVSLVVYGILDYVGSRE